MSVLPQGISVIVSLRPPKSFVIPWAEVTKFETRSRPRGEEGGTFDGFMEGLWTLSALFSRDRMKSVRNMQYAASHQREQQRKMMEEVTDVLALGLRDSTGFESEVVFTKVKDANAVRAALIEARGKFLPAEGSPVLTAPGGAAPQSIQTGVIHAAPEVEAQKQAATSASSKAVQPAEPTTWSGVFSVIFVINGAAILVGLLLPRVAGVCLALIALILMFQPKRDLVAPKKLVLGLVFGTLAVTLFVRGTKRSSARKPEPKAQESSPTAPAAAEDTSGKATTNRPAEWHRYSSEMGDISTELHAAFARMGEVSARYPDWDEQDHAEAEAQRKVFEEAHARVKGMMPPTRYLEIHSLYLKATERFALGMRLHRRAVERSSPDLLLAAAKTVKAGIARMDEANRQLAALPEN